jgi:hypothetical protein
MCEQLGEEPDPEKMPIQDNVFPYEVQLSISLFELMPDNWDGMSGSYMGKDWSVLSELFDAYKVENRQIIIFFLKNIEVIKVNIINEEVKKKQKATSKSTSSDEVYPVNKR